MAFSKEISYEGSADTTYGPFDQYWCGHTFTTVGGFDLSKVGWYIDKTGSPPNGIIHVYATSTGLPTGVSLGSQALVASDVDGTPAWVEWEFDTPVTLAAATQYAICIDPVDGDVSNRFTVWYDNTSPSYTGGTFVSSSNDGASWSSNSGNDFLFRVYSGSAASYIELAATGGITFSGTAALTKKTVVSGTQAGGGTGRLIVIGKDELWYEDIG
jgi:hypothetical protein